MRKEQADFPKGRFCGEHILHCWISWNSVRNGKTPIYAHLVGFIHRDSLSGVLSGITESPKDCVNNQTALWLF